MSLFSKNKPTKRINFEGAWVELQYLSKGVKDEIERRMLSIYKDVDIKAIEKWKKEDEIPDEIPLDVIARTKDVEYFMLSKAIKKWSEEEEITIETVRDIDEEMFEEIVKEINAMNGLSKRERKN